MLSDLHNWRRFPFVLIGSNGVACSGHDDKIKSWQACMSGFPEGRGDYNDESELRRPPLRPGGTTRRQEPEASSTASIPTCCRISPPLHHGFTFARSRLLLRYYGRHTRLSCSGDQFIVCSCESAMLYYLTVILSYISVMCMKSCAT